MPCSPRNNLRRLPEVSHNWHAHGETRGTFSHSAQAARGTEHRTVDVFPSLPQHLNSVRVHDHSLTMQTRPPPAPSLPWISLPSLHRTPTLCTCDSSTQHVLTPPSSIRWLKVTALRLHVAILSIAALQFLSPTPDVVSEERNRDLTTHEQRISGPRLHVVPLTAPADFTQSVITILPEHPHLFHIFGDVLRHVIAELGERIALAVWLKCNINIPLPNRP